MFWEALTFKKKKDGGWRPVRLGYARENDKGGYDIFLDAMPAPNEHGYFKFMIQPPREERSSERKPQRDDELNDEIPY